MYSTCWAIRSFCYIRTGRSGQDAHLLNSAYFIEYHIVIVVKTFANHTSAGTGTTRPTLLAFWRSETDPLYSVVVMQNCLPSLLAIVGLVTNSSDKNMVIQRWIGSPLVLYLLRRCCMPNNEIAFIFFFWKKRIPSPILLFRAIQRSVSLITIHRCGLMTV